MERSMVDIWGMGGALPERHLTNEDLSRMVDTNDEWIVQRTGIHERRICQGETTLQLALAAAREALQEADVAPQELGFVLCASITPDQAVPSLACSLGAALQTACPCMDINAACSGFVYALHTAVRLFEERPILVVGAERLSAITDYQDRATCVLFGDGAGAAVVGKSRGGRILATDLTASPDVKGALTAPVGQGPGCFIRMCGTEVYRFATQALESGLRRVLTAAGRAPGEVSWYVPHQANLRIIKAASDALCVPLERFFVNIGRLGNTSSASVPLALWELWRSGNLRRGELVALSAFGGGLTSASALLVW